MTTESSECCKSSPSTECCQSTDSAECCKSCPQTNLGLIYGAWLLRAWLAVRAIQTGVEKFSGMKGSDQPILIDGKVNDYGLIGDPIKEYAFSHYHGVPEALMTKFEKEPIMMQMKWALPLYDKILGPALIVLGLTILLGIASRTSYFLLGLLYISLTWGLILIKEDSGVAWLGIHLIMIVMALWLSKYNRLCVLKKW